MNGYRKLQYGLELALHMLALVLVPRLGEDVNPGFLFGFLGVSWVLGVWASGLEEELRKSIAATCRRFLISLVAVWLFAVLMFPHALLFLFALLIGVQGGLACLRFVDVVLPAAAFNAGLLGIFGAVAEPARAPWLVLLLVAMLALRGVLWLEHVRGLAGALPRLRPLAFFLLPALLFACATYALVDRLPFLPRLGPPVGGSPSGPRPRPQIDLEMLFWTLAELLALVAAWFLVRWLLRRWLLRREEREGEAEDAVSEELEFLTVAPAEEVAASPGTPRARLIAAFLRILARLRRAGLRPRRGAGTPGHLIERARRRWPERAAALQEGDGLFAAGRYGTTEIDEAAAARVEQLADELAGPLGDEART